MQRFSHLRLSIVLLSGLVACFGAACSQDPGESASTSTPASTAPAVVDTTSATTSTAAPTPEPESTETSQADYYQRAIDRASSAFTISQAAQSQDDWNLAVNRWQQAIALLEQITPDNPNHGDAQTKLAEYRRNLDYAQQQANRPATSSGSGIVVTQRDPEPVPEVVAPQSSPAPSQSEPTPSADDANELEVVRAPIIGRAGGTPVINVLFNGDRAFPMIVDTGASGTLITPIMAASLGVQPIGQTTVATASSDSVTFSVGRVRSMEVNGVVIRNVQVAVSGPELDIGLLGHDFFGNYDVTIREDTVEFRARR